MSESEIEELRVGVKRVIERGIKRKMAALPEHVTRAIDFRTFLDAFLQVFKDGKINTDDTDVIVEVTEELYEQYVRPFDIPGIPATIEKYVDDLVKSSIRPIIVQILETIEPA